MVRSVLVLWGAPPRDNGMPVKGYVGQIKKFGDDAAEFEDVYHGGARRRARVAAGSSGGVITTRSWW